MLQAVTERLPVSIELMILAEIIGLAIGVPLAIVCAARSGGAFDRFMTGSAFGMLSVPAFLSAILLIYLFAVELRWLPATGYVPFAEDPVANLRFMVLPALTLALAEWPGIMRVLRSDMIATLQEDYIALAKAKGLKASRILFVHALKPSSLTLVTITGINIGRLIGGAVIVETIFALPGIGRLLVGAIYTRDLIILQGVVLLVGGRLRADELHRRYALRRPRSQDPSWPRLNSTIERRCRRRCRRGAARRLGPLFWLAIGWMIFDVCGRDLRRRAAVAEPDRHGHAGAAGAVLDGALARHRRPRPRRTVPADLWRADIAGGRAFARRSSGSPSAARSACSPAISAAGSNRWWSAAWTCCWRFRR